MRGVYRYAGLMAVAAMAMPAIAMAAASPVVMVEAVEPTSNAARKRARRAALVVSGYNLKRSKGGPGRRRAKPNRLHISRRVRRRIRRSRRGA